MHLSLQKSSVFPGKRIAVSGSKSETNRLLLLQAIFPEIVLENVSSSDDSAVMQKAIASNEAVIDIRHAGTAMRFLTAYFSVQDNRDVILTGSSRMKERPIGVLVDALRELGAQIAYLENEGFPPLTISGRKLINNKVGIDANVSSQFISALLLIAPKLENGIEITLKGQITSLPYLQMTLAVLNQVGIQSNFEGNVISVQPRSTIQNPQFTIESDWSSASYFYSIVALSPFGTQITLSSYKEDSLQGDSALVGIYKDFGVTTAFTQDTITLRKENSPSTFHHLQLNNTPDIAQTIAVTCFGLGLGCHLTGLHTLKIKETDRLGALKAELQKLGAVVSVTEDALTLEPSSGISPNVQIATYNDHRMAMAFAPLALKTAITILDAEVVSKSYPAFWDDLKTIGFIFE